MVLHVLEATLIVVGLSISGGWRVEGAVGPHPFSCAPMLTLVRDLRDAPPCSAAPRC